MKQGISSWGVAVMLRRVEVHESAQRRICCSISATQLLETGLEKLKSEHRIQGNTIPLFSTRTHPNLLAGDSRPAEEALGIGGDEGRPDGGITTAKEEDAQNNNGSEHRCAN